MGRLTSQGVRQAIFVSPTGPFIADYPYERLELFDENGDPVNFSGRTKRDTIVQTTTSLAPSAIYSGFMDVKKSWRILKLVTNRPARIRIYNDSAVRDADAGRGLRVPSAFSEVLFEIVTTPIQLTRYLTPAMDLTSKDPNTNASRFYISVTNLDSVTGTVVTTYTYLQTE